LCYEANFDLFDDLEISNKTEVSSGRELKRCHQILFPNPSHFSIDFLHKRRQQSGLHTFMPTELIILKQFQCRLWQITVLLMVLFQEVLL